MYLTRGREICSNLVRSEIMLFIEEMHVSLFNNTTPLPLLGLVTTMFLFDDKVFSKNKSLRENIDENTLWGLKL